MMYLPKPGVGNLERENNSFIAWHAYIIGASKKNQCCLRTIPFLCTIYTIEDLLSRIFGSKGFPNFGSFKNSELAHIYKYIVLLHTKKLP